MSSPRGLALAVLLAALPACRGASPVRSSAPAVVAPVAPALPPVPPAAARLQARVTALRALPSPSAEDLAWLATAAVHLDNNPEAADALALRALQQDPNLVRALALRCVLAAEAGRQAEMLERCAHLATRAPTAPEAEVALAVMATARGEHPDYGARMGTAALTAMDACQAREASCGELAAAGLTHVLALTGRSGDLALYQALVARAGTLTRWTVAGPYAGHDVANFRRLAGLGEQGIPVDVPPAGPTGGVFFRTPRTVPDGALYPALYASAGLYVAESWAHVARPSRLRVDVRSRASVRVFVDGVRLATLDRWAAAGPPRAATLVVAVPGWHRVTLEFSGGNRDSVEVRLLGDSSSSAVDNVQSVLPDGAAAAPAVTVAPAAPRAARVLQQRAAADPGDVEAALGAVLVTGAAPALDVAAARGMALDVAAAFPGSARVRQVLAAAVEADTTRPSTTRAAEARRAYQEVLERQPDSPLARHRLAVLEAPTQPEQAQERLRALVTQRPEYGPAWRSLFELYRARDWNAEAADALTRALDLGVSERVLDSGASFFSALQDLPRARTLRDRWAKNDDNPASTRTAVLLEERLEEGAALSEWQRLLRLHPDHPEQRERLALLRRGSEPAPYVDALLAHLTRFPADEDALTSLCAARRWQNDKPGLKACLERLRMVYPSNLFPDRLEAELAGVDLGDTGDPEGNVDPRALLDELRVAEGAGAPFLQGHPTVVLLDRVRRVLKSSGANWMVRHRLVRIGTKEAADQLGEQEFGAYEEKRLVRVWKPDGRVVEPEAGQSKPEVSLSDLGPGDVLEIKTVGTIASHTPEGGFLEVFYLAGQDPVLKADYVLESPESVEDVLKIFPAPGVADPETRRANGMVRRHWHAERVEPLRPEPFSVAPVEHAPRVLVALRPDAALDARTQCRRLATSAQPTPELLKEVALLQQQARGDPAAYLAAVLTRVRENVEPAAEPVEAAATLAAGRGYHLTLVRALLRLGGIPARVLVARSALQTQAEVVLPRTHDVLLLLIPLPGQPVLLPSVGAWLLEDQVPPNLASTDAVEADCDEVARLGKPYKLPAVPDSAWEHRATLELVVTPSGEVDGTFQASFDGLAAPVLRQNLGQMTAANLQQVVASLVVEPFPGAAVQGVSTSDLRAPAGPLEVRAQFKAPGLARPAGGGLVWDRVLDRALLKPMVGGLAPEDYLRVASRKAPLLLSRPLRERTTARILLPPGSVVKSAPRSFRIGGTGFYVSQDVRVRGATVELTRVTHVDVARIPAAEYPAFRAAVEQAVQQGRNRLEFRLGP